MERNNCFRHIFFRNYSSRINARYGFSTRAKPYRSWRFCGDRLSKITPGRFIAVCFDFSFYSRCRRFISFFEFVCGSTICICTTPVTVILQCTWYLLSKMETLNWDVHSIWLILFLIIYSFKVFCSAWFSVQNLIDNKLRKIDVMN